MPTDTRTLLFIHGARNDDPNAEWRGALDAALRREGTATLAQRGYEIVGPTHLRELEARSHPTTAEPELTYRKMSDQAYVRTAGRRPPRLVSCCRRGRSNRSVHSRSRSRRSSVARPCPGIKELERKLRSVERALEWFEEHDLNPSGLAPGDGA